MNKAFLREPDDDGQRHCPRCGSLGVLVQQETLDAQLVPAAATAIRAPAYFCPYSTCTVAYFDAFEREVPVSAFRRPVWPKDPAAPLCPCFDLTADDVEADLREGGVRRVRSVVERARTALARCQQCSPTGQPCIGEVQRYFLHRRQALGGGP